MRDLLIFFGEYRNFDVAIPHLKNLNKFDIIVSTWNRTQQFSYKGYPDECLEKYIIDDDILKYIPTAKVIIHDIDKKYMYNTTNMISCWKRAIESIGDLKYNKVILHRTDMISTFDSIIDEEFDNDTIYLQSEGFDENGLFINDYFFAGNFDIIKKFVESFELKEYPIHHYPIGDLITNMNFFYKDIKLFNNSIKYELVRYNHRDIVDNLNKAGVNFFDLAKTDELYINYMEIFKKNSK
jgi:hypothetical protein